MTTQVTCPRGHGLPTGASFCPTCGITIGAPSDPSTDELKLTPGRRNRNHKWLVAGLVALVVAIAAGLSTYLLIPRNTRSLMVTIVNVSGSCAFQSADLNGASVRVGGDHGSVQATTELTAGHDVSATLPNGVSVTACSYGTTVSVDDHQAHYVVFLNGARLESVPISNLHSPTWTINAQTGTARRTVNATITDDNGDCSIASSQDDLSAGMSVTVTGGSSSTSISTATLPSGVSGTTTLSDGISVPDCTFHTSFSIPLTQTKYTFDFGYVVGGVVQSTAQLVANKWALASSIGSGSQDLTFTFIDYTGSCNTDASVDGAELGTPVIVTGDAGSQIGQGALGVGTDGTAALGDGTTIPDCTLTAYITVPTNQNAYTVKVGSISPVTYAGSTLSLDWQATLTYNKPSNVIG